MALYSRRPARGIGASEWSKDCNGIFFFVSYLERSHFVMMKGASVTQEASVEIFLNKEVREFILKKFPLARKQRITDRDDLLESGLLDSQGVLEVVSFIEQRFSVVVADDDLVPANFQTIAQIAGFIERKMTR